MQIETKTTTKARNGKNYEYTAFTFSNKKTFSKKKYCNGLRCKLIG